MAILNSIDSSRIPGSPICAQLVDPDSADSLTSNIADSVERRSPRTRLVMPSLGCSAMTVFCNTVAASALSPSVQSQFRMAPRAPVSLVFKWIEEDETRTELASNEIAAWFGFSVPAIQEISTDIASRLFEPILWARRGGNGPESMNSFRPLKREDFCLSAMNRVAGDTLSDVCKNGKIHELTQEMWDQLFFEIGKIAVFDLFIVNKDRFSYFGEENAANTGNVIVQMGQSTSLKLVLIDNGSSINPYYTVEKAHAAFQSEFSEFQKGASGFSHKIFQRVALAIKENTKSPLQYDLMESQPALIEGIRAGWHTLSNPWFLAASIEIAKKKGAPELAKLLEKNAAVILSFAETLELQKASDEPAEA